MNEQNQEDPITESQSNDTVYQSLRPFPVSFYNYTHPPTSLIHRIDILSLTE